MLEAQSKCLRAREEQLWATVVATVKVTDANRVMKNISEGGGAPLFANAVKLVIYRPALRADRRR